MIFQQNIVKAQEEIRICSEIPREISVQEMKDIRWRKFCEDHKIEKAFHNVSLSDLKELSEFSKEKIKLWMCSQKKNIIFYGVAGSGKSHAGLALIRYYLERSENEWVRHIYNYEIPHLGKENGAQYLRRTYGECKALMIDDFGLGSVPEWELCHYFSIIDSRFNQSKPTIFTTNLSENELEAKFTKRIMSRIPAEWVRFEDIDNRVFGF